VGILVDVVNAVGVEQGCTALDAMHRVALFQQKLGKVRAVLARDAGYQRYFAHRKPLYKTATLDFIGGMTRTE
jgi:hypothetical protein